MKRKIRIQRGTPDVYYHDFNLRLEEFEIEVETVTQI